MAFCFSLFCEDRVAWAGRPSRIWMRKTRATTVSVTHFLDWEKWRTSHSTQTLSILIPFVAIHIREWIEISDFPTLFESSRMNQSLNLLGMEKKFALKSLNITWISVYHGWSWEQRMDARPARTETNPRKLMAPRQPIVIDPTPVEIKIEFGKSKTKRPVHQIFRSTCAVSTIGIACFRGHTNSFVEFLQKESYSCSNTQLLQHTYLATPTTK